MPLTSETKIDKVEILEDGQIQVREAKVIYEDGKEISKSYHRMVLDPARDTVADATSRTEGKRQKIDVASIAGAIWTPEKIQARKDFMAAQAERGPGPMAPPR